MLTPTDFMGTWQIERTITDRLTGQAGTFRGTAEFTQSDTGLDYAEQGSMKLGDGPMMTATRRYHWLFTPELVQVSFDDGRDFHTFVPNGAVAGTDHPCGDDHYKVAYDFTAWPDWRATWTVSGPRKDYTSISQYRR